MKMGEAGLFLLGVLLMTVSCNETEDKPVPVHFDENSFTTESALTTLRVVTIEDEPYVTTTKEVDSNVTKYEGFIIDVIEEIFKDTDFEYEVYQVHDGKYGSRDRHTGEWDGLIGDVQKGKAHIAAAALSITDARRRVVAFTEPWAEVNLTVIVQSDASVSTLEELVAQKNISYGLIKESSVQQALTSTKADPYAAMWVEMGAGSRADELFVSSSREGLQRVLNDSNYGFVTESTFAKHAINKHCGLKTVGSFLPREGYGFAVGLNDDIGLKTLLDDALNKLKDSGKLQELQDKYWGTESCDERNSASTTQWLTAIVLCFLLTALRLF